jgi:hypothetical protein
MLVSKVNFVRRVHNYAAQGVPPRLRRGRISKGFERGTGLALRLNCPIELALPVIRASDHGQDVTVSGGNGNKRLRISSQPGFPL